MRRDPLAVIDIGSNTIRSLVVEPLPDGTYRVLDDEREVARLASGLQQRGRLSAAAIGQAVKALRRMAQIAGTRGAREVAVVATSAIRNASNRRTFLDRVRRETGLQVRVISGAEEAQLAFESAAHSFDLADRPVAVVDVGGGSTEVVLAIGPHVQRIYSLALGAVALTERFMASDPPRRREFKALRAEVRRTLEEAGVAADPPPQLLVASGGTASTLAQIAMALDGLSGRPAQGHELTQARLMHIREALLRRTLAERRQMPGLSPDRADIFIAGVVILSEILAHLNVNTMKVSARGIRHALLQRLVARQSGAAAPIEQPRRLGAAEAFARSLGFEEQHARQVQRIALSLFDQLEEPLGLDPGSRDLLSAAALLHDVGYVVGFRQHHKHAYHLISHAHLDGFSPKEREVIALTARYHRRAGPRRKHASWAGLARRERALVCRLSALLRIADSLDRRHSQALESVACRAAGGRIRMTLVSPQAMDVEIHSAEEKAGLFEETFGKPLTFERVSGRTAGHRSGSGSASRPVDAHAAAERRTATSASRRSIGPA